MVKKAENKDRAMLAGIGLDDDGGHRRITRSEGFLLMGGSEETHETMKETAIRFNEKLAKRGKHLEELSRQEFRDLMGEALP